MDKEASWLILAMVSIIWSQGTVLQGIDESASEYTEAGKSEGVAAVLHRGSAFGGEKPKSGRVDQGQVGRIWGGE